METKPIQELSADERRALLKEIHPEQIQAMNRLGLQLIRQLGTQEASIGENLLISPYSIAAGMGMAYYGSNGETRREMAEVMGWSEWNKEQLSTAQAAMHQFLTHPGAGIQIEIANAMWIKEGITVEEVYKASLQQTFEAEISPLHTQPERAKDEINQWVEQHTRGKILQMMQEPPVPETLMILVNAIAFNGNWMNEFEPEHTKRDEFLLADGSIVSVPMMQQSKQFHYTENEDWQAIRLPYGNGQMHLLVVLPREDRTLEEVQQQLEEHPKRLEEEEAEFKLVDLSLPRFRAEYGINLKKALQQLGMEKAFDPYDADFTKMIPRGPDWQAYIGQVIHRAVMEVNEQGTVAAASTLVEMRAGSAPPTDPVKMEVNRPFMVAVVDGATGAWVFAGAIHHPEQQASQ
ncbi:serpin family protein [Paenibacillus xylanilyticus]|uniref:Serpin family protein n=1 Tax=Paenibacillus xylanilyticus TaxID=248903 RepID=A0A7Y6BZN1_9BACL|nr:serpin family protein [Paenibacillus xylanilyticus]NUU77135.1 serpin family protein [Paenibacillus xylanilyticus]